MNACSVALIVNPVAGMGGALGLKGTDGELAARARAAGAPAVAAARTAVTLSELAASGLPIHWLTAAGDMGAEALRAAGFVPKIVYTPTAPDSSAEDTRLAAQAMLELEPALLLFAGGDGTARDLHEVVGQRLPVLGIPAGV
jgi:predicted polyphosphate/ATP-dependent NAD kinase